MKFQCMTHGEVNEFKLDGYGVAHEPQVKAHEKDFEGITFVIESPKGNGKITSEHIRPERTSVESYLEKFAGWGEDIAQFVNETYHQRSGVEKFKCPHNDGGLCVTKVVDDVFVIDLDDFSGFMGVYDDTLEIHSIYDSGPIELEELFEKITRKAKIKELKHIKFETTDVDKFKSVLAKFDFEIIVKEEKDWQGNNYNTLYAELVLD